VAFSGIPDTHDAHGVVADHRGDQVQNDVLCQCLAGGAGVACSTKTNVSDLLRQKTGCGAAQTGEID